MEAFAGKTAVVTGGASGIGLGLVRSFAAEGMNVVMADIEDGALAAAEAAFADTNLQVMAVRCDVGNRAAVNELAARTAERFGPTHILCNNAGVAVGGPLGTITAEDWDWILDINLRSVIYGIDAFLPAMQAHGEGGHIVNTASMAALVAPGMMGPYAATKFAVAGLTETLRVELTGTPISASVLCPGWVKTKINQSGRNRLDRYGGAKPPTVPADPMSIGISEAIANGMSPDRVGQRVLEAIRQDELYIFTHPDMRVSVEERFAAISAAFDRAETSRALAEDKPGPYGDTE